MRPSEWGGVRLTRLSHQHPNGFRGSRSNFQLSTFNFQLTSSDALVVADAVPIVAGRDFVVLVCVRAAGPGIGNRSGGHPQLGQDHELKRQIRAEYQQNDEQIIQRIALRIESTAKSLKSKVKSPKSLPREGGNFQLSTCNFQLTRRPRRSTGSSACACRTRRSRRRPIP